MKKRSAKASKTRLRDAQVAEFEKRDVGGDLRASGMGKVIRPRPKATSIVLDEDLVARLREKGSKRGLGYQTMLKLIVHEHIDEY